MAYLVPITSEKVARAIKARDAFLKTHPHLVPFQRKIERILSRAKTSHNRLVIIHELMMDSLMELHDKIKSLRRSFEIRAS